MRVIADISVCQGHQLCCGEAPDIFGFDKEGDHVVILQPEPGESRRAEVTAAVRYCPSFALSIEED
jgi:ferredoxin